MWDKIFQFYYVPYEAQGVGWERCVKADYRITLSTPELISIVIEGMGKPYQGRYSPFACSLTFDANTLEKFGISDFVLIDEHLANKLLSSKKVYSSMPLDGVDYSEAFHDYWDAKDMTETFIKNQGEYHEFYLTPSSIGIQFGIQGGYVWVEVPLEG